MIRRLFWLGIGVGVGVLVVRAVTRQARRLTPAGLAGSAQESVGHAAATVRSFVDDVRDGMADREEEIRLAFEQGAALDEQPDLTWARDVGGRFTQFQRNIQAQQEGEQRR